MFRALACYDGRTRCWNSNIQSGARSTSRHIQMPDARLWTESVWGLRQNLNMSEETVPSGSSPCCSPCRAVKEQLHPPASQTLMVAQAQEVPSDHHASVPPAETNLSRNTSSVQVAHRWAPPTTAPPLPLDESRAGGGRESSAAGSKAGSENQEHQRFPACTPAQLQACRANLKPKNRARIWASSHGSRKSRESGLMRLR